MFRISRGLKAVAALGVTGLAATLLGACTPAKLGAAAMVGDQRISTAELNTAVKQWQQAYTANPVPSSQLQLLDTGSIPRSVLFNLIQFKVVDAAARRLGVRVSDGAVDDRMNDRDAAQQRALAFSMGVPPQQIRDYTRAGLETTGIAQRLKSALKGSGTSVQTALANVFAGTAKSVRVDVNPRYGKFDYTQLVIDPNAGRLSRPETPQLPAQG